MSSRMKAPNQEMMKLYVEEAKWKYNNNEYKAAALLYIQAHKFLKAIEIYGKHKFPQDMISKSLKFSMSNPISRNLSKTWEVNL